MSSDKRIEASRRNGALSKGRKTPEGIQRSSRNALKHGLTAEQLCCSKDDTALLNSIRLSYFDYFNPVGPLELDLLQDIVIARFRLQRCIALESQAIFVEAALQEPKVDKEWIEPSEPTRLALAVSALVNRTRTLDHYRRYETLFRRTIERSTKELERVQAKRNPNPPSGPQTVPVPPITPEIQKLQNDPKPSADAPPVERAGTNTYPAPGGIRPTGKQCYVSTCDLANTSKSLRQPFLNPVLMFHGYENPVTRPNPTGLTTPKVKFP